MLVNFAMIIAQVSPKNTHNPTFEFSLGLYLDRRRVDSREQRLRSGSHFHAPKDYPTVSHRSTLLRMLKPCNRRTLSSKKNNCPAIIDLRMKKRFLENWVINLLGPYEVNITSVL